MGAGRNYIAFRRKRFEDTWPLDKAKENHGLWRLSVIIQFRGKLHGAVSWEVVIDKILRAKLGT